MGVRRLLKCSEAIIGLVHDARKVWGIPTRIAYRASQRRVIKDYLASHAVRKLQIGAGRTSLDGWLSSDIRPAGGHVLFLDATKPFPFAGAVFDYVFSEHMIEHITWSEGLSMLRECRRVLKPGGKVRIATPDLRVFLGLYQNPRDPLNEAYMQWFTALRTSGIPCARASFVVNAAFRNWGHQFLYDGELLTLALQEAGFINIQSCVQGASADEHLRGIESHGKNVADDEMAAFETMVYEGQSPA
jgi:predicted SAM-dependent methyltransferase